MSDREKISKSTNLILKLIREKNSIYTDEIRSFLYNACIPYSENKSFIYKKYDIDNTNKFNFFESISDKWYRENFHSDILYTILNPETKEIGRKLFIQEFVKFLGISFNCDDNIIVTKEKGKVDLLIRNSKKAIIIENKINYAPDMDNQLVRYMQYVEEVLGIDDYVVIYLTLINDSSKKPPIDSYDKKYEKYTQLLRNKNKKVLYEEYAVDEEKSLANTFLPNCITRLENEKKQNPNTTEAYDVAIMYISQYKILLEHLGGEAYMSSTDKKLIEEIFSDKEKFNAANDFITLWEKRNEIIKEFLQDKFKEKYNWELFDQKYKIYVKSVNEKIDLFYQIQDNEENSIQFGYKTKGISKSDKSKLLGILENIDFKNFNLLTQEGIKDENPYLYIDLFSNPPFLFQEYFEKLSQYLDELIGLSNF